MCRRAAVSNAECINRHRTGCSVKPRITPRYWVGMNSGRRMCRWELMQDPTMLAIGKVSTYTGEAMSEEGLGQLRHVRLRSIEACQWWKVNAS